MDSQKRNQMQLYNSVIIAYRRRPECLKLFLRSLELALGNVKGDSVEVVITELCNDDDRTQGIINEFKDKIHIKYFPIQYTGNFWKSKALNHSARFAEGDIITMVDVDALVPPVFFVGIEKFFGEYKSKSRLGHRVRFLNDSSSNWFRQNPNFSMADFNKICVSQSNKHKLAKERYSISNLQKHEFNPNSIRALPHDFRTTQILGNSHFSMQKDHYMKLGGFDERFIGYGCEDLDFNVRALRLIGQSRMKLEPSYTVYHLSHKYEKRQWKDKGLTDLNRRQYKNNRRNRTCELPITSQWGTFIKT